MAAKMSDAELKKELLSLGEKSIGPITETTRALYLKKLNRLRDEKKKHNFTATKRNSTRTISKKLVGLSSDESEEDTSRKKLETPRSKNKNARTRAARSGTSKITNDMNNTSSLSRPSLRPRHNLRQQSQSADKDSDNLKNTFASNIYNKENSYIDKPSMRSAVNQTSIKSTLNNTNDLRDSSNFSHSKVNGRHHYMRSEFSDSDQEDEEEDEEEESLDNGLDFSQTNFDGDSWEDEPEMVSHSVNTSLALDTSLIQPGSRNTSGYLLRSKKSPRIPRDGAIPKLSPERYYDQAGVMDTDGFKAKESTTAYKLPLYISRCLVILPFLFFAVIAVMYVSVHFSKGEESQESSKIICTGERNEPLNCVNEEVYKEAFAMVKVMSNALRKQAVSKIFQVEEQGRHECGYTSTGRSLKLSDIKSDILKRYGEKHFFQEEKTLNAALVLITNNSAWEIRLYDNNGKETNDTAGVVVMESLIAEKDVLCRLAQAMSNAFNTLLYIFLAVFVLMILIATLRYKWKKQQEEKQQVYELVEKIIDILKEHSENCQQDKDLHNYLAIPHVRDMLIPLKQRKKKQPIWDKAVKFLSANESRVRVETQLVHGEEFAVWRWIQTGGCANGGKVWQGQAFGETKDVKANFPNFTPLPCLKIRNMFNAETEHARDWHIKVQDAILEKSGPSHGIVHMAVDISSKEGCVYVKCDSREAAGKCFSALHGWWFDGKLITVKFLREERYYERFPESRQCSRQLKPSNDQRSSLAQPYHKSFLEEY